MSILLGVIVVFALLTLAIAIMQAVAMVRLAPAGEHLAGFMPLGWWKFRQLERKAGPAAAEKLNIYKRAVIAFLVFLVMGLVLSVWSVNRAVPSADLAFNIDFSRAATEPGTLILES